MNSWLWILRSRLRTHLIWFTILAVLSASWLEFSLYVWTLLGAIPLTDGRVAVVFTGAVLTKPITNVAFAIWGAATAAVDIRSGVDRELKVRQVSLLKRTLPHFLVVVFGGGVVISLLCWLSLHASPFVIQSASQFSQASTSSWLSYWSAVEFLSLFMWTSGYYATFITRSQVWGTGLASLVPALFFILPMQVSANLPGPSLSVWALKFPLTTAQELAQLSGILKSHADLQATFSLSGVVLSAICLIVLHILAARR